MRPLIFSSVLVGIFCTVFHTSLQASPTNLTGKWENPNLKNESINCKDADAPAPAVPVFVSGSLFAGFARNSVWLRASINTSGTIYFTLFDAPQPTITASDIKTYASTSGAQVTGEKSAVTAIDNQKQVQVFTASETPLNPSFTGTPYAGARFTGGIDFPGTYYYYIVAENTDGFSTIISGSGSTQFSTCSVASPGSNQTGSSAKLCGPRDVVMNVSFSSIPYDDPYTITARYYWDYEATALTGTAASVSP
ncbi:MAG TPA: hypothetical protein VHL77_02575, partial [Ferruginibacter sp.]|nr:hypothetical protein [Ferruginibacter sp.]